MYVAKASGCGVALFDPQRDMTPAQSSAALLEHLPIVENAS
jgi:hypothetical protein